MDDYLTTRQVQDFLKVDRITVYRMLSDGRLKGVKIGQQWRFTRREVERLMTGEARDEEPAPVEIRAADAASTLPLHCIQTIQNLFSDVAQLNALVIDMQGEPMTLASRPDDLRVQPHQDPAGPDSCQDRWRSFVEASQTGQRLFTCPDGLHYAGEPILDEGERVGLFLIGPFRLDEGDAPGAGNPAIPFIPSDRRAEVFSWPAAAVRAIHSVLCERSGFLNRLQQIANLTQIP